MNYALAKELKDKGFPQLESSQYWFFKDGEDIVNPTLSELIEACGDRFDELTRMKHYEDIMKWMAAAYPCEQCGHEGMFTERGKTPEEAVAKLWLALNT